VTAPGERLTPQQMGAEWDAHHEKGDRCQRLHGERCVDCDLVEQVLAAWQADREALEQIREAVLELRRAYEVFTPLTAEQVSNAVGAIQAAIGAWGSDRLHAQWARTVLGNVLAELDAAQGETR